MIIIQTSQLLLTLDKIMASALEEMTFPKILNGGTSINDFYFELSEAELSLCVHTIYFKGNCIILNNQSGSFEWIMSNQPNKSVFPKDGSFNISVSIRKSAKRGHCTRAEQESCIMTG